MASMVTAIRASTAGGMVSTAAEAKSFQARRDGGEARHRRKTLRIVVAIFRRPTEATQLDHGKRGFEAVFLGLQRHPAVQREYRQVLRRGCEDQPAIVADRQKNAPIPRASQGTNPPSGCRAACFPQGSGADCRLEHDAPASLTHHALAALLVAGFHVFGDVAPTHPALNENGAAGGPGRVVKLPRGEARSAQVGEGTQGMDEAAGRRRVDRLVLHAFPDAEDDIAGAGAGNRPAGNLANA